jgi:hypothetical protein
MQWFAMPSSGRRALSTALLAVALAAGVSACGSSSTSSPASASTSNAARYQARLNLAKCLRGQGLNVPDPSPNGGPAGGEGGGVFRSLQNYSQSQIQTAVNACRQYVAQAFPRLNLSPAQQAQFRQEFVKFAECMRAHGVDIPDPSNTGSGIFGLRGAFKSIDRNSPAFRSALAACQSVRPRLGRGGPGGPGGPGGSGGSSASGGPQPGGAPGA